MEGHSLWKATAEFLLAKAVSASIQAKALWQWPGLSSNTSYEHSVKLIIAATLPKAKSLRFHEICVRPPSYASRLRGDALGTLVTLGHRIGAYVDMIATFPAVEQIRHQESDLLFVKILCLFVIIIF